MRVCLTVTTDDCIRDLQVSNAKVVVHYDIPADKDLFAGRLWCMRDNFLTPCGGTEGEEDQVLSLRGLFTATRALNIFLVKLFL